MDERVRQAGLLYERAVFTGDPGPLAEADRELGLAYIAAAQDRGQDALALLDEAGVIAEASRAHRVLAQVNEARAELPG